MSRDSVERELERFLGGVRRRNPHEQAFHQAVAELAESVLPLVLDDEAYRRAQVLERMTEPDRIVSFRVTWQTDDGTPRAHRAWRVQFNHALGPYKGGLRFAPDVDQDVLKFLGFEQTFKNALTGLPMGGAKGGANFNPKGKSDDEVMRFCQSLMTELHRHIGEDIDVPAGDIGVGSREIDFLFGQYMRLNNRWSGVLTGKGIGFGGSAVREEATGYGCIYFLRAMLEHHGDDPGGKRAVVSGSGNVALHCAEKALDEGLTVLTLSDTGGVLHAEDGLTREQLEYAKEVKRGRRGRLTDVAEAFGALRHDEHGSPWNVPCDVALPCATQNELDEEAARTLVGNGVRAVCEGANMPTTRGAVHVFRDAGVLHAPGKASNAGGVAVSGLEQSQNAMRLSWTREEVDAELRAIMRSIHDQCVEAEARTTTHERVDYVDAANVAGFRRVAEAMLAHGIV